MKSWAVEERPREKVLANGIQYLSDSELLAILLGSGTRNLNAVELARQILLESGNNLHELGRQQIGDLLKIRGIGFGCNIKTGSIHNPGFRTTVLQTVWLGHRFAGKGDNPQTEST